MAISEQRAREATRRLLLSRMRILCNNGFYGLLLMHMKFSLDESAETAYTDGERIAFGPDFLDDLSDGELDFVMMHEILHVVLQHVTRGKGFDNEAFNIACDIVVNSNILLSLGMDRKKITLAKYGEAMNIAPDGKNGYEYSAEEVYEMLPKSLKHQKSGGSGEGDGGNGGGSGSGSSGEGDGKHGSGGSGGKGDGKGKTGGAVMGRAVRRVGGAQAAGTWDDHTRWGMIEEDEHYHEAWVKRLEDAAEAISIRDPSNSRGLMPAFAKRLLEELHGGSGLNWRELLCNFVQEEVNDYSFSPPDRRYGDSDFFLPDFNDSDEQVRNILFMIDTSGSMSDKMITDAYSEIAAAIDQFGGKLQGWLGFFDAAIIEPQRFVGVDEMVVIRPAGGGGTDFGIIFEYVRDHMKDEPPVSIVILTDGYAPFPPERMAMDIPVLWLINNEDVTPPWGKVARIVYKK